VSDGGRRARGASQNATRSVERVASLERLSRRAAATWLRSHPMGVAILAVITGLGAGVGAIGFRALISTATAVFTGQSELAPNGHPVHPLFPELGIWFIVAVPAIGGLIYGPLIDRFAREARGHGVPEVMLAVAEGGARIRPRVALVKSLASAVCLGAGGSVGREGPIVQIGSALGSGIGQALRLGEANLRVLVACGAAGGISATFNAPIAGVFFALELILRDFGVRSFGAVVLSSVTAAVVGRAAWGSAAFLPLPPFQIAGLWDYGLYAVLGVLAAITGVAFIRTLYGTEDVVDRLWGARPEWLRPVVGGVASGALLLVLPQLYGVGYAPLAEAVKGNAAIGVLLVLLVGKLFATSLTIAIGGSGGVFAPSLFLGGMLGAAFGSIVNGLFPGAVAPAGAFGLVGMGAVFAGAARAPITAVLMLFELTGDYQIILPMMLAIAVAAGISALVSPDTIYTLKLRRRGIDIAHQRTASPMDLVTIREAMRPVAEPLFVDQALSAVLDRLATEGPDGFPVADRDGGYVGILTPESVEEALRDQRLDRPVGELLVSSPALPADSSLGDAVHRLVANDGGGLAVVEPRDRNIIGWLTHQDVLRAYAGTRTQLPTGPGSPGTSSSGGLSWLRHYRVVDIAVGDRSPLIGRRLDALPWPAFSLPISHSRKGRRGWATPGTIISAGDRLTVLVGLGAAAALIDRLTADKPPRGTAGNQVGT
jgi:chloride channel protein, CIC family